MNNLSLLSLLWWQRVVGGFSRFRQKRNAKGQTLNPRNISPYFFWFSPQVEPENLGVNLWLLLEPFLKPLYFSLGFLRQWMAMAVFVPRMPGFQERGGCFQAILNQLGTKISIKPSLATHSYCEGSIPSR